MSVSESEFHESESDEDKQMNIDGTESGDADERMNIEGTESENEELQMSVNSQNTTTAGSLCRGRTQCLTPRLAAILDKLKISDRNAVHLLTAAAEAFGQDPKKLILNKTSIRERRSLLREQRVLEFRKYFQFPESSFLVIHWDGKLLPSITGNEKVDRLAILTSFNNEEQLLGVPETGGKGEDMAEAVYSAMVDWGITKKVVALCCDTTASNTGRKNGACINLERLLEKNLLYLPCRHHIFETVLRGVFDSVLGPTSGPDTPLFKRFKESWPQIDRTKVICGLEDENVRECVTDVREAVLEFVAANLKRKQFRDDYKEFLELTALLLNADFCGNITVRAPGAIHHARWMAKALYCMKIFLFRKQFHLTRHETDGVRVVCVFFVRIYVKAWFEAPFAIEAPYREFLFLKSIQDYKKINEKVGQAAVNKFIGHLWYLSPELVALSLFDENVPLATKKEMSKKIQTLKEASDNNDSDDDNEEDMIEKRVILKAREVERFCEKDFEKLISISTLKFFSTLNINIDFFKDDLVYWPENIEFQEIRTPLKNLRVVNDIAERGIKLITDYNNALSKNESQKQYLLQIISEFNKKYLDAKKSTVISTSTSL